MIKYDMGPFTYIKKIKTRERRKAPVNFFMRDIYTNKGLILWYSELTHHIQKITSEDATLMF